MVMRRRPHNAIRDTLPHPAEVAGARLRELGGMVVAAKVSVTGHATAGPAEALRPVLVEPRLVRAVLVFELVLVLLLLLDKYRAPAKHVPVFVFAAPGYQLQLA